MIKTTPRLALWFARLLMRSWKENFQVIIWWHCNLWSDNHLEDYVRASVTRLCNGDSLSLTCDGGLYVPVFWLFFHENYFHFYIKVFSYFGRLHYFRWVGCFSWWVFSKFSTIYSWVKTQWLKGREIKNFHGNKNLASQKNIMS